jgi:hypothetical protein
VETWLPLSLPPHRSPHTIATIHRSPPTTQDRQTTTIFQCSPLLASPRLDPIVSPDATHSTSPRHEMAPTTLPRPYPTPPPRLPHATCSSTPPVPRRVGSSPPRRATAASSSLSHSRSTSLPLHSPLLRRPLDSPHHHLDTWHVRCAVGTGPSIRVFTSASRPFHGWHHAHAGLSP